MSICDCAIIGGGAVGLSIAYALVDRGKTVTLIDRTEPGRETSWAGAGILPPAPTLNVIDPLDQLRQMAMALHPAWAENLLRESDIDTGFRRSGGLYLAVTAGESASLTGLHLQNLEQGIESSLLSAKEAIAKEPALLGDRIKAALELPGECQIRNPRHLRALLAAAVKRGLLIQPHADVTAIQSQRDGVWSVESSAGSIRSRTVCVAAGAWSQRLLAARDIEVSLFPMRGQIVLYRCERQILKRIINLGPRYLVPRDDGRILVGSTEEEVGFDKRTTAEGIADLRSLAESLVPELRHAEVERSWAGLRPASFDSLPYMGECPGSPGLFVACGHFRSGLYLSPAVGVVMADLICGESPPIDLWPFRVSRG